LACVVSRSRTTNERIVVDPAEVVVVVVVP